MIDRRPWWLLFFALPVQAQCIGSAMLSWEPPTERTDGTPLDDLAGYRVYRGTASADYSDAKIIDDPEATWTEVDELCPGEHYFAATALDSTGLESVLSNEVSKVIDESLIVDIGDTAFYVQVSDGRINLIPIGTVTASRFCDETVTVSDSNGVTAFLLPMPYEDYVDTFGGQELIAVFAECQP